MKRFYGIILLFTALAAFKTNLQAQVYPCAGITVAVATAPGGTSTTDYYLAKVTIDKTYAEDITVAVTLFQDGNQNNFQTASVTVLAGYLTAESSSPYLAIPIGENAAIEVTSISPCPASDNLIRYKNYLNGNSPNENKPHKLIMGIDRSDYIYDINSTMIEILYDTVNAVSHTAFITPIILEENIIGNLFGIVAGTNQDRILIQNLLFLKCLRQQRK